MTELKSEKTLKISAAVHHKIGIASRISGIPMYALIEKAWAFFEVEWAPNGWDQAMKSSRQHTVSSKEHKGKQNDPGIYDIIPVITPESSQSIPTGRPLKGFLSGGERDEEAENTALKERIERLERRVAQLELSAGLTKPQPDAGSERRPSKGKKGQRRD